MVTTSDQSRQRKDATSKMEASNIKSKSQIAAVSGIWPCKINGCTKQFAREADLKRHQRTTKLHSRPGFACPQCDATFTRTDALRRHQKSRHNGVILDPLEQEETPDPSSPTETVNEPTPLPAPPQTVQGKPSDVGPATGHLSYYRQHTAMTTAYIPQYSHVGLPTSATRLNAANWSQPAPWKETEGAHYGHPGPTINAAYCNTSHYYRQSAASIPPEDASMSSDTAGSRQQSPQQPSASRDGTPQNESTSSQSGPNTPEAGHNEPSSLSDIITEEQMKELSMHLTSDALEAMLKNATLREAEDGSRCVSLKEISSQVNSHQWSTSPIGHHQSPEYAYPNRPESMEPVMTEDGEPMLNPAEFLTQESLASPASSC